jgi:hypothetical protein
MVGVHATPVGAFLSAITRRVPVVTEVVKLVPFRYLSHEEFPDDAMRLATPALRAGICHAVSLVVQAPRVFPTAVR